MPASATLATTTLTYQIDPADHELIVASGSGIYPGYRLWIDRELITVKSLPDSLNTVKVIRGVDGTAPSRHSSSSTVTIGRADQFFATDPYGAPGSVVAVSPYINVLNGKIWYAQGDALPDGLTRRWWQEVTYTYPGVPLGITQPPSPTPIAST